MSHGDLDVSELREVLQALNTVSERLAAQQPASNAQIHVHNDGIMRSANSALGLAGLICLILFAIWAVPAIRDNDAWLRITAEKVQRQQAEIEALKKELNK